MINNNNNVNFWKQDENGKIQILNTKLYKFLESKGFAMAKASDKDQILVRMVNNMMSEANEAHVDHTIRDYLLENDQLDVYEKYARSTGSYVNRRSFNFLKLIELVNDRDKTDNSYFYYQNCFCKVTKDEIDIHPYEHLQWPIWENRLNMRVFEPPTDDQMGQFEKFCNNITGKSEERFLALKTILGYLLHRNKEVSETKAIILYDENMGQNNQAHGGTGKSLLGRALSKCRVVEIFDGKENKLGSWFRNQRIDITTDILVYDDLDRNVSLERFYAMITSGIEVERKRQQAFYIDPENAPKIMISSNYPVNGPGGSSDERRRHEFELSNYYSAHYTPEMEFGNRFFGNDWSESEWNKFFQFMMNCAKEYLQHGLIEVKPINLGIAKLKDKTNEKFVEFAETFIEFGEWQDKREFEATFQEFYPELAPIAPHRMKKWLDSFAASKRATLETKPTGGNYLFRIRKEVQDA
ncbi:hypothetical protein SAMN06265375_101430 [Muriicola jejuensis]|uniref:NrS-1 polymerase-like helicase domain-containing protein n=1 Tax=Muriicola jejuensis TaxID=504488 RepID=A0A6P0UDP4_9FLAO|nr:primase-helicase family protein [Muriicola jejuensis]NER10039.1 hypothetical protein [Muriicola jejuensis]SMP03547.1 hypothetical protein SAMN06265375_101430 [Muriicola jejuensis]